MLKSMFCMRLHTAGVVFGWLGVVGSFVMTILMSVLLGNSDVLAKLISENKDINASYEDIHLALVVVFSICLALIVLNLLSSGLLVLGTIKNRHLMLLPWLINSGFGLSIAIINLVSGFIAVFSGNVVGPVFPALIAVFLGVALEIYIYYGIYSLFKQIQLSRAEHRPLIAQTQGVAVPHQGNTYPNYTKI